MVTIKIDERTRAGKAILEIVKIFSKDKEGVEIVETAARKAKEVENIPNKLTLKSMEDTSRGIGLTKCDSVDDLFEKLEI
jgi:hypothetical protein